MTQLDRLRSEIPLPELADLRAEERRLLEEIAGPARSHPARRTGRWARPRIGLRPRLLIAGGLALAVATGIVVAGTERKVVRPVPPIASQPVAAVSVLVHASDNAARHPELHPRPGQYLVYESRTMNPVESNTASGHSRYLARGKRTVWYPVAGTSVDGFIAGETLPSKPYPGWPLPPEAKQPPARTGPEKLADFDQRAGFLRTDYAYLSRLPADTAGMRRHLFTRLEHSTNPYTEAWSRVAGMLREAYLPAAQRAALFRAAATIPGVVSVPVSTDAAGRKGVAAALVVRELGIREEYIFDPKTYQYLGERSVVIDAARAKAPVGSVLTSSALLRVSVADSAPPVRPR
ncbi:CU044_5270 family protein [Actinomadura alba]|uniref:CU044_5270 family protein n=1 Tax=Actinomadura alba TaxID=406431 RepID=A0ABR7LVF3_9ACTN|nr:CU044_5270 family protein [Actinomadura alba]